MSNKSQILIVSVILFLLPLLVVPFKFSWFEVPKVIVFEITVELMLLLSLVKGNLKLNFRKIPIPIIGLLLLSIIDLIFLRGPNSFFGNIFRLQGIFLLWHLIVFSILSKDIKLHPITPILAFVSIFSLLLGILILGGNQTGRAVGTLGEPNSLAAAALFIWPFALSLKSPIRLIPPFLAIAIALVIIFLSGSRSGLIGFSIECLFLFGIYKKATTVSKMYIFCLSLIILSLILPFIAGGGWYENRSEVWQTAFFAELKSPILGSGFGNIQESIHSASLTLNNNVRFQVVDSSHNILLDYWIQGGIIGLGLLLGLIYQTTRGLLSRKEPIFLAAFLGLLTVMSFNPVGVVSLIAFWYLLGQGTLDNISPV